MTWVRLDDTFPEHPKVLAAGGDAAWLHICAIAYCNRNLTDGFVPTSALKRLSDARTPTRLAGALVDVNLWEECDGGWLIHDYHMYQPTRAEVLAEQQVRHDAKVKAGQLGGLASGIARRKHNGSTVEADVKQNEAECRSRREAEGVAKRSPDPTRPSSSFNPLLDPSGLFLTAGTEDDRK